MTGLRRFVRLLTPRDRRGVAAILFAISATSALGLVGLGTEAGLWYLTKTNAQTAADMAAYAGAVRLALAQSTLSLTLSAAQAQAVSAATDAATLNAFTAGTSGGNTTTVNVHTPPTSGNFAGDTTAVQVSISRTLPRLISGLFLSQNPTVSVSSTVKPELENGSTCLLALSGGVTGSGSPTLNAQGCTVGSNATGNSFVFSGSPSINAALITAVGQCVGCGGMSVKTNQPALLDPFQKLQQQTFSNPGSACKMPPSGTTTVVNSGGGTIYYCSSMSLSGSATVTLPHGTYVFYNASLSMSGSATIKCSDCSVSSGDGITMIFTGSSAGQVGSISMSGSNSLNWNAPKTSTFANDAFDGVALYRDALGSTGNVALSGTSTVGLTGAIYLPTGVVQLSGGSAVQDGQCHVLVAQQIVLSGGTAVGSTSNCSQISTATGGTPVPRFVE